MVLNTIVPVVEGILIYKTNDLYLDGNSAYVSYIDWSILSKVSVGLLQIFSGFVLGYAVIKIRQFLKRGLTSSQLNGRILVLHCLAFSLYIGSDVVYYVYDSIYNYNLSNGS